MTRGGTSLQQAVPEENRKQQQNQFMYRSRHIQPWSHRTTARQQRRRWAAVEKGIHVRVKERRAGRAGRGGRASKMFSGAETSSGM